MSMDIYFIQQSKVYSGIVHKALYPTTDCYKLYIPFPYSVVVEKGDNGKFDYKKDRESIRMAESIIKGEVEGKSVKVEMDVQDISALLYLGTIKERADSDFNGTTP